VARKSLLDQATHDLIVDFVRKGNFVETAAQCCGIAGITVRRWLAKGKRGDPAYAAFYRDVTKARAMSEVEDLAMLHDYAATGRAGPWQALAWILEKRNPKRFSRNFGSKFPVREKPYDERPLGDIAAELQAKLTQLSAAAPAPATTAKPTNGHKPKQVRPGHATGGPPKVT
jgi:hypothetical protein